MRMRVACGLGFAEVAVLPDRRFAGQGEEGFFAQRLRMTGGWGGASGGALQGRGVTGGAGERGSAVAAVSGGKGLGGAREEGFFAQRLRMTAVCGGRSAAPLQGRAGTD